MPEKKKYGRWLLIAIVCLGTVLRFYGIELPLVDSHQIRQAQTAMMARNLYEDGINIFCTRLDFFGNTPGHIIMEFPLMHALTAWLYNIFGVHDVLGRLVSILFSVGAMFFMYGLARKFLTFPGAMAALIVYAFSPMNIFFSRAFMPESSMMFFMVGAVYLLLEWFDRKSFAVYLGAIACAALAYLVKPTAGIALVPILAAWFLMYRWVSFRRADFWLYMVLSTLPVVLWAGYAHYFNALNPFLPAGFGGNWLELILTRGITEHWFRLRFYSFVGGSIILLLLTPVGFIGSVIGAMTASKKGRNMILYAWLGAVIAYLYVLSGPNSGHVYYQLPLLPLAAIFFGFAVEWLIGQKAFLRILVARRTAVLWGVASIILIIIGYMIGYSKYVRYMYENRMPYTLEAAKIIKNQTPENRFIVLSQPGALPGVETYYAHSKTFYFSTGKSAIKDLEHLRAQGATTYVAIDTKYGKGVQATKNNKAFWQYLNKRYRPVAVTDHYIIFDIRKPIGGR